MPIKKDETGKRWVEMELLVPGTPEQVWQAMATGPGYAAWFTKAEIEEKVGGSLRFLFGPEMESSGQVTFWEPPHKFGYVEYGWSEGAPPVATEITITSRSGDKCVVRMVHSLFSASDDWDNELEGFEGGWPAFFEVLRLYLAQFAGKKAASASAMVMSIQQDAPTVWTRLTNAFGFGGGNAGEQVIMSSGPEPINGVIENIRQDAVTRFILLRVDKPAPGIFYFGTHALDKGTHASMSFYFYGDDAAEKAAAIEPVWREWFTQTVGQKP